jgi:hypothetical protein
VEELFLMTEVKAQKGSFRIRGKIVGFTDQSIKEDRTKSTNRPRKVLRLTVQTSPTNKVFLEVTGYKMDAVTVYNKKMEKSKQITWDDRKNPNYNTGKTDQFNVIQQNWDLIDDIKANFESSNDVVIIGKNNFSKSDVRTYDKYEITKIYKSTDPIDFEADDFDEENTFDQECTFVSAEIINDKVSVNTYIFQSGMGKDSPLEIIPKDFIIYPDKDPELGKFATDMLKVRKFGDTFKVFGRINNQVQARPKNVYGAKSEKEVRGISLREMEIFGLYSESFADKLYNDSDFDELRAAQEAKDTLGSKSSEDNSPSDTPSQPWKL